MPIESRIASATDEVDITLTYPGPAHPLATDYSVEGKPETVLLVKCNDWDNGGEVFKVPIDELDITNHALSDMALRRHHFRSVPATGYTPTIPIRNKEGKTDLWLIEHHSQKFVINPKTGRPQTAGE